MQRDRDQFRAESQDLGWAAWFLLQCLVWAVAVAMLAVLDALGHPMWSLLSALMGATGGLGLARAYHRYRGRKTREG